MNGIKQKLADEADGDWMVSRTGMFVCPCGQKIEDDGECPQGHKSPMLKKGLI